MIRLALPAALPLTLLATPALAAAGKPFFSLANTDFVVTIGFLIFIGIIFYAKVPGKLGGMLDDRSKGIERDLDEARTIREDAQKVLADYERKTRAAKDQADEQSTLQLSLAMCGTKTEVTEQCPLASRCYRGRVGLLRNRAG